MRRQFAIFGRLNLAAATLTFTSISVAAVPESVIKVLKVENGVMTYQNTGMVPLGAVFVRSAAGDVQWMDYSGTGGMKPGTTETFPRQGENATTANTEITTVIFQTGQVLGDRPKRPDGTDVVQEVFGYRTGQAEAWAKWKKTIKTLPADPEAALSEFIASAKKLPPHDDKPTQTTGPLDYVQQGRNIVERGVSFTAKMIEDRLRDGTWNTRSAHEYLINTWLDEENRDYEGVVLAEK